MGRVAKLLEFIRTLSFDANTSDAKVDNAGGDIIRAPHSGPAGDDAHPLPGDYAVLVETPRHGGFAAVGYVDPKNQQTAQAGERRIYARDPQTGDQIAQVWLKKDGTIVAENDGVTFTLSPDGTARTDNGAGYIELKPDGVVEINGATVPTSGDVITASGVSLDNHTHAQGPDSAGNGQAETEVPTV